MTPPRRRFATPSSDRNRLERLANGELIAAAEVAGFELLLTTDKNMRYQQNLTGRKIAFVVIGSQRCGSTSKE
jgi:hypothetical protein